MVWQPDYVSLAEAKGYERIAELDDVDDVEIALAVTSASRAIDRATNRQFGNTLEAPVVPESRRYTATYDRKLARWLIPIDDLSDPAGIEVVTVDVDEAPTTDQITGLGYRPLRAAVRSRPWEYLVVLPSSPVQPSDRDGGVQVTADVWGWAAVPDPIKQATLLQTSRFLARRNAPFGVAGSPELGSEIRLQAKVDPDVAVSLGPYIRWWAVK